jgi:hypothetical protein
MRSNRREQLNQYWRDHRQAVREAKERAANKSVDSKVFLTNINLLCQVASWMASQGGEAYARKELDRIGVSSAEGINQIIESAKELSRRSF